MITDFCTRLSELGCYPDILTFQKYSYYELLTYLKYVKKFLIVSDNISLGRYEKIVKSYNKFYKKYKNKVFDPIESTNKLNSFLKRVMSLLISLVNLDGDDDIRAIIFNDSIKNILKEL